MKFGKKFLLALALGGLASVASAGTVDPAAAKAVTTAIHKLIPGATIDAIDASPLPGVYTVVASGQVAYVSADGKYLLHGSLYDIDRKIDLTSARMDGIRKAALAKVPEAKRLEFAPENPKYRVTVFTDIDCGYCRKLHSHMDEYNKAGIAVDYLFFPRTGLNTPSYDKAVSVWCAKDRKTAFTEAKLGKQPAASKCANPVADEFALGQQLGVDGTPTIIASDGSVIGGYLTPAQMLQRLQAVAARQSTP
ncbi:MAG TPA: DsbC family protein [Rhodanobacteraceae bacterium]|nr:DsbC family protein [Rhodanobacteraceae bacterium]